MVHEHPRLAALAGLTENAAPFSLETSEAFALGGPDQYLPQQVSVEEPGELLDVLETPAEPLRYHTDAPKTFLDVKMATKVMNRRCDSAFRLGSMFAMQIC